MNVCILQPVHFQKKNVPKAKKLKRDARKTLTAIHLKFTTQPKIVSI